MGSFEKSNPPLEPTHGDVQYQLSDPSSPTLPKDDFKDDAESLNLKARPIHKAKTGAWRGAKFLSGLALADWQMFLGVAVNLVPFLVSKYSLSISTASTITTDFLGSSFLLAVVGGFIADSFLGGFYTVILGGIFTIVGLAYLTVVTTAPIFQPPECHDIPALLCTPAGMKYVAPLYAALYCIALGSGLVKPTLASLAADQFDESVPAEKSQILNFFIWFYFLLNIGIITAFTLGVYLQTHATPGWGPGFSLMLYVICFAFFLVGAPQIRRKQPSGSFVTRMAQVFVANMRKWNHAAIPNDLYDPSPTGKGATKTIRTNKLRFMDRAAIIDEEDKKALESGSHRPDPWRLCSLAQVEETKRLLQLLPIWASTTAVTLVFSMIATFTVQQGTTMDRNVGNFTIPAASLISLTVLSSLATVPIYNFICLPILKRFTGSSYGLTPIQRMGMSMIFAILAMVSAGVVERKRLTYVRELHLESAFLGLYSLPMKFWWLLPQLVLSALVEFFFYVSAYEFFFFEASEKTRNIGSSFTFSSAAIGYFTSGILVNLVNSVTRNDMGGSWLVQSLSLPGHPQDGQLNTGGLAKFYFLLAVYLSVTLAFYCTFAYFYECKHDWYGGDHLAALDEITIMTHNGENTMEEGSEDSCKK